MQSRGVRRPSVRPSVCLSVCKLRANRFFYTTEMAGSPPNSHTMVPRWACIQGMLKFKVKVKGHVIRTLLWCHENRFFSQANDWNATKLAHDGSQPGLHPGCDQGQGRGQRSRDTGTSVMSRNVCYTVRSHVLSLHALSLYEAPLYSPSSISFRQLDVLILEWATPSLTVWLFYVILRYTVCFDTIFVLF